MKSILMIVTGVVLLSGAATAQQPTAPSAEDLQNAYAWCTHRYFDHADGGDSLKWQPGRRWQPGFENCQKIIDAIEAKKIEWNDVAGHKNKIDAIAAGIK